MAWLLFMDESGHNHKELPYEVRGGYALADTHLWPFVQDVLRLELSCFGARLAEYKSEVKGMDEKFKDPNDPLGLVFVCAMWLTGFDAPSCSTVYLDKPMRNHTLMQTIARANRVFPGKHSGMIVDYANVFASLEKTLAIYGTGGGGATPVRDKQKLVAELRKAVDAAWCSARSTASSCLPLNNCPPGA
jgi:type I restriction enzyme R subunit